MCISLSWFLKGVSLTLDREVKWGATNHQKEPTLRVTEYLLLVFGENRKTRMIFFTSQLRSVGFASK